MEQFHHFEDFNIYSSCRTCLKNLNGIEMHYDIFAIPDLQQKLAVCTSLPVELEDGLPTSLCEPCHNKIEDFYIFQQMCISSRTRFQEYLHSERKPCPMELAKTNNPADFMIFTITKKENDEEDPMSPQAYSEHLEADPSYKVQDQFNTSSNEEEAQEESQHSYSKYNINSKDNSSNDEENEGTLDGMIGCKKINVSLNRINLECEICKKRFKKTETFEVHMRVHQGLKPYPCQLCDKSYSSQGGLKLHIKDQHEERPDVYFLCPELGCDRIFSSKQTLGQHMTDMHWKNGKKRRQPHISEECGKVQTSKQTLGQHMTDMHRKNGKKRRQPHISEECGKVQTSLDSLKNHRDLHTQQPPHECPQCHKRFTTKIILKDHINRHDGIKNYTCPHCGATKTTRRELKKHVNCHTKEKKYPCQFCDMVYYNVYNLKRHKRLVHEGIKDYHCSYCEKSFGRSETRKHHEMTHTGERPHECNICHKKFIQFVSLRKHATVHLQKKQGEKK